MEYVVGTVKNVIDTSESGEFQAYFDNVLDGTLQWVTYTSPYYRINGGGVIAIPDVGDQILALYNENPSDGESLLYYHSTIIKNRSRKGVDDPPDNFEVLRSSDSKAKIYNASSQPVTQTFTNSTGAGIYIQRDFSVSKISNNVTLRSEGGEEINTGPLGVQIKNAQGDSIVLNGSDPNDDYAARSFALETQGPQLFKCIASDINMLVRNGGDINIENNSFGDMGLDKWYGNVRLKSRYRNIDLAAVGDESYVNIFTQGATIQVDSQGTVKIFGQGSIQLESPQDISLNAGGNVNIYGGGGVQVGSGGAVNINGTSIAHNSIPLQYSAGAPGSDYTNSTPVLPAAGSPPAGTQFVPNDYNDPTGAV